MQRIKSFRHGTQSLRHKTKIYLIRWTIKFNKVWSAQGTIRRMRRQTIDWGNIFINHVADKRLLLIIMKDAQNSQWKNKQHNVFNGQKKMTDTSQGRYMDGKLSKKKNVPHDEPLNVNSLMMKYNFHLLVLNVRTKNCWQYQVLSKTQNNWISHTMLVGI